MNRKGGGLGVPRMVHFGVQAVKKCNKNECQNNRNIYYLVNILKSWVQKGGEKREEGDRGGKEEGNNNRTTARTKTPGTGRTRP